VSSTEPLDLDKIRAMHEQGLAFIRSGAPASEAVRAPSVLLAFGSIPKLLAEVERLTSSPDREAAKAAIHPALHDLNVRIVGLDVGDCHCNLVAEVILDAIEGAKGV
jgi:hypothetical protein